MDSRKVGVKDVCARIREYQDADYEACRSLWAELTQYHRLIYNDSSIGGNDPGAGMDEYLANPGRHATWVAEDYGKVVGMTGLLIRGEEAEIEPVIVAEGHRSRGIGHALVRRTMEEARARGMRFLGVRPVARNVEAMSFFADCGFGIVGHVQLFQCLKAKAGEEWKTGITLHDLRFRY